MQAFPFVTWQMFLAALWELLILWHSCYKCHGQIKSTTFWSLLYCSETLLGPIFMEKLCMHVCMYVAEKLNSGLPRTTSASFRNNYWMRLSRIWRILQIKEGVIHRGRRPRWITPSEICRILHILQKPNSIIALLFIQNISSFLKEFRHYALCFSTHQI